MESVSEGVKNSAELVRGLKSGIVAGLIYGILYALMITVLFQVVGPLLDVPTSAPIFGGSYVVLSVNPFMAIIVGPIFGIILGLIYAFVYQRLPERKIGRWSVSSTKGALLALVIWLVLILISIPTRLSTTLFFSEFGEYQAFQIVLTLAALWLFLVMGIQLGSFWDRFKPK